jgi:ribonuclease P protein component
MAGFSVPKKKFRSSVDRHRIRRLMVESWRLHKHILYAVLPANKQLHLFIIFTGKTMPDYELVHGSVVKGIEILVKKWGGEADVVKENH